MKHSEGIKGKSPVFWGLSLICCVLLTSCQPKAGKQPMLSQADLVIYTVQEKEICEPVVKEFEERTGLNVKVETGSVEDLLRTLEDSTGPYGDAGVTWDVIFGVGIETLEEKKEYWQAYESSEIPSIAGAFRSGDHKWTGFSACPLVIMYNTNVVTYREVPAGWTSLLEPRWKGRVAFMDPGRSDIYSSALATAVYTYQGEGDYMEQLAENLEYGYLSSLSEVNSGIMDGKYSLGVTIEGAAQALRSGGADVDYIYPKEGTTVLPDGTAIVNGCNHPETARRFLDFTVSKDAQMILVSDLNRRSVRLDVPPFPGLSPVSRLQIIDMDGKELSRKKEEILKQWNEALSLYKRRSGG
ncbi:extracellular solute-binding protein [Lacrimispora saccharolytica]|uniref:Extracellular solute-binding protein family 1 n=1 Tax=Lacrimispora saccharolytica (strain ATCC 35040 / DSM 2544 / NRCC 2533 / WM1) TaxID=610130 RepID=D9R4Z0_LACSW|nr:extracellular solute-binding protein [Lacrimispora saccharolytica]ADL05097.1 extracellular solute-binding protein family 1 [[Clostridium] saccharolyticum WM1]QRV20713.1 extracellular solute-binding protein [Lacrimispora saccharolytica]